MTVTTQPAESTTGQQPNSMRSWGLLLVVCGALFLEGIDIAMLNVAVPAISAELGLAEVNAHWIISAYVLGYAGFMLLGGRVADLVGRRRVFLVALAVFIAFSVLGGVANSGWLLIVARFATGVAAAFMTPAGFSIVTTSFPAGSLRDRALAVYGAVGAAGFTLGMVAGGLLTSADWRWVFFAPVLIGGVLLVAGIRLIRPDEPRVPGVGAFDVVGSVTITGGMVALVFAVVSANEGGLTRTSLAAVVVAVGLFGSFVAIERRAAAPLVRLGLLGEGILSHASLAGLLFMGAFFGFQFALTLYLQELRGWSPLEVGLTFAIMGADLILAPLLAPRLAQWIGNAGVMTLGASAALASYLLALRLSDDWGYLDLLPSLLLVAVAFALVYAPLTGAATEGIAEAEHGVAGGLVYTAFQFGGALGLSIVTAVLLAHGSHPDLDDYSRALLVPAAAAGLAVLAGAAAWWRRSRLVLLEDVG
jgi:MFS family permease